MNSAPTPPSEAAVTAWARLLRVSQSLLDAVEADLKAAGMPALVWYDALLELRRSEPDGLRPFELQDRMLLAQYNLSRLVDRIVKAGYAERHPCEQDARGHLLRITRTGTELLDAMWPVYRDAIGRHFAGRLDAGDTAELARLLGRLQSASPAPEPEPAPSTSQPPARPTEGPVRRLHLSSKTSRRVRFFSMKPQS